MPIRFACFCGRSIAARDELAGKRVRCPGCGDVVMVPPKGVSESKLPPVVGPPIDRTASGTRLPPSTAGGASAAAKPRTGTSSRLAPAGGPPPGPASSAHSAPPALAPKGAEGSPTGPSAHAMPPLSFEPDMLLAPDPPPAGAPVPPRTAAALPPTPADDMDLLLPPDPPPAERPPSPSKPSVSASSAPAPHRAEGSGAGGPHSAAAADSEMDLLLPPDPPKKSEPEPAGGTDPDSSVPVLSEPKLTFPDPLPDTVPESIPDPSPPPPPSPTPAKLYRPTPPPPEPPSRTWIWIAAGIAAGILVIVYGILMMYRREEELPPPRQTAAIPDPTQSSKPPPDAPEEEPPPVEPPKPAAPAPDPAPPPPPPPVVVPKVEDPPKSSSASTPSPPVDPVAVRAATTEALKPLLEQLQDANPQVRNEACLAIERLGADATAAIPALRAALIDPDKRVRQSAYRALRIQHDVSIDVWTEAIRNPDPDIRLLVLEVLPFYKEHGIPPLIGSFHDKVDAIRTKAAERLAALPWETPGLMESLQAALRDNEIPVRQAAAHAFAKMPPGHAKPAIPALAAALSDPDVTVRTRAGEALGRVPESAKLAVEALAVTLRDRDPAIRARSAKALAMVGPRALDAAPLLIDLLDEEDLTVRDEVSKTLRGMKNVAPPLLFKALQGKDVRAQDWARLELINRGEETAKAVAAELPRMKTREDRYKLVRILTEQKDKAADAVPVLLKHLKTSDEGLKEASADSLVRIGPALAPHVTELAKLLDDKNPIVKERIGMTLRGIGPAAAAAAPQLVRTFKGGDLKISVFIDIMAGIGVEAVPSLIGGLRDSSPDVREGCASALGRIGPAAKKAVSALTAMLKREQDREAKTAAQNALKMIQGR